MRILLAVALLSQAASLDDYYKFKSETTWTYKRTEGEAVTTVKGRVIGEESGKVKVEWKEYEKDGKEKETTQIAWWVADGILTVEARSRKEDGQDFALTFPLLKEKTSKGDTWKTELGEWTHQGTAEVKVPAGTYKDAVWTQVKIGEDVKIDFYLVPKVGLVKVEINESGGPNRFELTEFVAGK